MGIEGGEKKETAMSGIARASIISGPGIISIGAQGFYPKGNIEAALEVSRYEVANDVHGVVDHRLKDAVAKIRFTPAGEVEGLTTLFPHTTPVLGASIFGAADVAAIVQSKAGTKVTFYSVAVTKMPDLYLSAAKTLFGQVELTAIRATGKTFVDADSLYKVEATAFSDATFASANIKTGVFTGVWGALIASIIAESGWTITFDQAVKYIESDESGTTDGLLQSVGVMAKCRPLNLTESVISAALRLQGVGITRGMSIHQATDLVLTSAGLVVTIKNAALVEGPLKWGTTELRAGEIGFIGNVTEAAGVFTTLFTVAAPT
jgi:hypothetical protein